MIKEKKVKVKNSKYYKDLGYYDVSGYVLIPINYLSKGSGVKITAICSNCKKEVILSYEKYNKNINKTNIYSCKSCSYIKRKNTSIERYGVENVMFLEAFKDKVKETNIQRYGVENIFELESIKSKIKEISIERYGGIGYSSDILYDKSKNTTIERYGYEHQMKSESIKNKIKETCLEKYGVENLFQSEYIKDKIKVSNLEKYGVECSFNSDVIKDKIKETNLKRYGYEHHMKSESIKNKIKETCLYKYGVDSYLKSELYHSNTKIGNDENYIKYLYDNISLFNCEKEHTFEINIDNYQGRISKNIPLCTVCNPIGDSKSIKEKELFEYTKFVYSGEIIQSYRDKLEIDIYLPELKIGFEFNGLYWHSEKFKEKNYHLDKSNYFKEKGIRIIHIWEDDWSFKQDIVKSQIDNLLGKSQKIYARKCIVKEVSVKETRKFLDNNHIQGFVNSSFKIGLYHQDELVSIMTFDSFEGRKKMEEGGYNLSRFCNKLGYNVVGGASKLLSYFIKEYKASRIVSYADKDWSVGNLYYTLGFENVGGNGPDYKYIVDNKRVHKSRYKKSNIKKIHGDSYSHLTEKQATTLLGIYKIYDCGKIKFEIKL